MSAIYDNWERLVAAVLKKQQLWQLFHQHSRSPSVLSEASGFSSSFSRIDDLAFDLARLGSSSTYRRAPNLVFISGFHPFIDLKDVSLASSEFLGRGTFGTAYAAVMDNGVRIVVKRLNSMSVSVFDFNRHMTSFGNVRHENVAALRAYYSSADERLGLYDYYSSGSVYDLLHGRNGEPQAHVDWESRLRIAIGAARGISEIHKHTLVHGNIRSSNVFRNPDQYGCVSDLGLTNLFETTFIPTAHCYAPEVKNTQNLSQPSDVYSFGVLLLELLTRKSTAHVYGGPEAVDLVKLVTSVRNRVRAAKVFDADLLKDHTVKEQMVKMLQIGMRCVEKSIKKRPKMSEVVKMLEEITTLTPISHAHEARELEFIEYANAKFDLEDMLRASAEVLGKGAFGTSYKAVLKDGSAIRVKRMKDVIVSYEDFQDHMKVIGRMRHDDIAELRAYFYHKDEKLLLYDYYSEDSVFTLLHGRLGSGRTRLDLETRLNIAVGAARGIAHIHKLDGRKLVHGNIKSSNIFLNIKNHAVVSDAGLFKLTSPIKRLGYHAPEVTDTRRVSQASDVYSFGVLLLELLSRKQSQITGDDGKVISLVNWIQSVVREEWTAEVFDLEIPRYGNELETMVQLLQIAMECANHVPEHRPRMSEVVKMLEEISGIEPLNELVMEEIWEQPSIPSRLEDLVEDMLSVWTA